MPFQSKNLLKNEMPSDDFSIAAKYIPYFGLDISLKWSVSGFTTRLTGIKDAAKAQARLTRFFNKNVKSPYYLFEEQVGLDGRNLYATFVDRDDYKLFADNFPSGEFNPSSIRVNARILKDRRDFFNWKPIDSRLEQYIA
jgi:hypothetical protein